MKRPRPPRYQSHRLGYAATGPGGYAWIRFVAEPELRLAAEDRAAADDVSLSEICRRALREYLDADDT